MKKFINPEIEIIKFNVEDIVTASPVTNDSLSELWFLEITPGQKPPKP